MKLQLKNWAQPITQPVDCLVKEHIGNPRFTEHSSILLRKTFTLRLLHNESCWDLNWAEQREVNADFSTAGQLRMISMFWTRSTVLHAAVYILLFAWQVRGFCSFAVIVFEQMHAVIRHPCWAFLESIFVPLQNLLFVNVKKKVPSFPKLGLNAFFWLHNFMYFNCRVSANVKHKALYWFWVFLWLNII